MSVKDISNAFTEIFSTLQSLFYKTNYHLYDFLFLSKAKMGDTLY